MKFSTLLLLIPIVLFLTLVFVKHGDFLQTRITPELIESYLHSQDIAHEVYGRVFLSDSDIHLAAGYLYSYGADPTKYNFQHPPFIKYLFGLSNRFLGNPLYPQLIFAISSILLTSILANALFQNKWIGLIAATLLAIDPLFIDLARYAMLDLGQMTLLLAFIYSYLCKEKRWFLQGLLLGLLACSKFWGVPLFFFSGILFWQFLNGKFNWKRVLFILMMGSATFTLFYVPTFLHSDSVFNIIFFELKTLKYWLSHSTASMPGASLFMFITGFFKSWWGERGIMQENLWTLLWPLSLLTSVVLGVKEIKNHSIRSMKNIIYLSPLLYLLYLGVQAPFVRYFIIILPFLYMSLAQMIVTIAVSPHMRKLLVKFK